MSLRMASIPSSFFSTLTYVVEATASRYAAAATAKRRDGRDAGGASFSQGSQMRMEQPWASRETITL